MISKRYKLKAGELSTKLYRLFKALGKGRNCSDGKEKIEENIKSSVIENKGKKIIS